MAFASFLGRVLFASVFILSAYQDGCKEGESGDKYNTCPSIRFVTLTCKKSTKLLSSSWFSDFGLDGGPAAKAIGPKFDVFTKHVHSHVAVQVPDIEVKRLAAAAIALKGIGGIFFIFGSNLGAFLLILHQLIATPILYDFYNYESWNTEFTQLFIEFTQNVALLGALLFFVGMKNSSPRRQSKKKVPKTKTV